MNAPTLSPTPPPSAEACQDHGGRLPRLAVCQDDPEELPFPGYARELAAHRAKLAAADRAASTPLPGPLRQAFAGEAPALHGYTLQPVRMRLHTLLVRIGSPLLEVVRILREELTAEDGADESTPELASQARQARVARAQARIAKEFAAVEPEALVETVFLFVRPAVELSALLEQGREIFRAAAMREVGDKLHPAQFAELQQLVSAHYAASFATIVQHSAPRQTDDGTVFSQPPAEPLMGSAGGSNSSAP